jgi:DNA-binding Lrp family transcriptional regulator
VLAYLVKHPQATTRKIAQEAGVTERAIQKVILDLEADGYIARHKIGRGNRYVVHPEMPMRHHMERDHAVGELLAALGGHGVAEHGRTTRPEVVLANLETL